ncbi:MarR family transcriptional regulator [Aciduricibacillus chroicocephali]|uniref:MarR family transcriptional regulator n=1 Tax=Aciduricibacillus chroicocephali TaxID=3054939 RepID=A0ABY9KUJ5_9BACI|nr:MarR family transcriptional regulator [Bacillaceae bacterium 44XB]
MDKKFEDLQLELASLVRYITSLTPSQTGRMLDRSGFLILQHIDSKGTASIKELATYFKLDISTMSRQVRSLEQKDYLARRPNPSDKRAHFLTVTSSGKEQLNAYRTLKSKRIQQLFGEWDEESLKQFTRLLQRANEEFRENNWEE